MGTIFDTLKGDIKDFISRHACSIRAVARLLEIVRSGYFVLDVWGSFPTKI